MKKLLFSGLMALLFSSSQGMIPNPSTPKKNAVVKQLFQTPPNKTTQTPNFLSPLGKSPTKVTTEVHGYYKNIMLALGSADFNDVNDGNFDTIGKDFHDFFEKIPYDSIAKHENLFCTALFYNILSLLSSPDNSPVAIKIPPVVSKNKHGLKITKYKKDPSYIVGQQLEDENNNLLNVVAQCGPNEKTQEKKQTNNNPTTTFSLKFDKSQKKEKFTTNLYQASNFAEKYLQNKTPVKILDYSHETPYHYIFKQLLDNEKFSPSAFKKSIGMMYAPLLTFRLFVEKEDLFQLVFVTMLSFVYGNMLKWEEKYLHGRSDAVFTCDNNITIIEFKYRKEMKKQKDTKEILNDALHQIETKYAPAYNDEEKPVFMIAVLVDHIKNKSKNIDTLKVSVSNRVKYKKHQWVLARKEKLIFN